LCAHVWNRGDYELLDVTSREMVALGGLLDRHAAEHGEMPRSGFRLGDLAYAKRVPTPGTYGEAWGGVFANSRGLREFAAKWKRYPGTADEVWRSIGWPGPKGSSTIEGAFVAISDGGSAHLIYRRHVLSPFNIPYLYISGDAQGDNKACPEGEPSDQCGSCSVGTRGGAIYCMGSRLLLTELRKALLVWRVAGGIIATVLLGGAWGSWRWYRRAEGTEGRRARRAAVVRILACCIALGCALAIVRSLNVKPRLLTRIALRREARAAFVKTLEKLVAAGDMAAQEKADLLRAMNLERDLLADERRETSLTPIPSVQGGV
jgi:hypothetical protein